MNGAWPCTKDVLQMRLNLALKALTPGSRHVGQASEKVKDALRAQLGEGAGPL